MVNKKGGRVLIAVNTRLDSLAFDITNIRYNAPKINTVTIKLKIENSIFFIMAVYIPPDSSLSQLEIFFDILSDRKSYILHNFMILNNLSQFNDICNINDRYLDLVLSSFLCEVTDNELPLLPVDKYHPPLIVEFESCLHKNSLNDKLNSNPNDLFYNFKRCNYDTLHAMLINIDWSQIQFSDDVDVVVEKFYHLLYDILKIEVGFVTRAFSSDSYPNRYRKEINQHGFVPRRSTATNLFTFINKIENYLLYKQQVDVISNLGPLLFVIYMNELDSIVCNDFLLYADDTKLFKVINCIEDCENLQSDNNNFNTWCNNNSLDINVSKCKVMTFRRRKRAIEYIYEVDGINLEKVYLIKDLVVHFTPSHRLNTHIDTIVSEANRILGFIFRSCNKFKNIIAIKSLFCSLVRSKFNYCSSVWRNITYLSDAINKCQKYF